MITQEQERLKMIQKMLLNAKNLPIDQKKQALCMIENEFTHFLNDFAFSLLNADTSSYFNKLSFELNKEKNTIMKLDEKCFNEYMSSANTEKVFFLHSPKIKVESSISQINKDYVIDIFSDSKEESDSYSLKNLPLSLVLEYIFATCDTEILNGIIESLVAYNRHKPNIFKYDVEKEEFYFPATKSACSKSSLLNSIKDKINYTTLRNNFN